MGESLDVVGKATPGRGGPRKALVSWGPEKMVRRCSKESHHPAEWARGLRLSSANERERHNADSHKFWGQNIAVMFDLQLPLTVKPHTTFSNPCNKVRGKYFVKEVFLRLYHCVCLSLSLRASVFIIASVYLLCCYDAVDNYITISECSKLAQREYKAKHDWVGKVIHWEMCKKFKFDHTNKWYMDNPAPVPENDTHKLL